MISFSFFLHLFTELHKTMDCVSSFKKKNHLIFENLEHRSATSFSFRGSMAISCGESHFLRINGIPSQKMTRYGCWANCKSNKGLYLEQEKWGGLSSLTFWKFIDAANKKAGTSFWKKLLPLHFGRRITIIFS